MLDSRPLVVSLCPRATHQRAWDSVSISGISESSAGDDQLWCGGCGLATGQVITILGMRQQYADGVPLAESMEDLAVQPAEQDSKPLIERACSHPVDAFSIGHNMGRTTRACGRVRCDGASAFKGADREAKTHRIERCRQA
jgi:hypothetical protein